MISHEFKVGQIVYFLSWPFYGIASLRKGKVTSITITEEGTTYFVGHDQTPVPIFATKKELREYYMGVYKDLYLSQISRLLDITGELGLDNDRED